MKKIMSGFAIAILTVATSAATVIYSTDFTSADGYSETNKINTVDGWAAQSGDTAALRSHNVGSNGELRFDANFIRGYNAATAFNVGDTITITASIKTIGGNTPGFDANILRMGLTQNTNLGTSGVEAGLILGANNTGLFRLANQSNAGRTDSIAIDTAYHTLTTTITKSATANQFDVINNFAGTEISSTVTDATLYGASTVYTLVFSQGQSNVGGVAIDSLSVNVIPEPATLGLIAAFGGSILFIRRQFMM